MVDQFDGRTVALFVGGSLGRQAGRARTVRWPDEGLAGADSAWDGSDARLLSAQVIYKVRLQVRT